MDWLDPISTAVNLGTPGAAAAAVYFMLNGSRAAIRRIEKVVHEVQDEVGEQGQRIARIEGRLEK